jgi:hypothetical protein
VLVDILPAKLGHSCALRYVDHTKATSQGTSQATNEASSSTYRTTQTKHGRSSNGCSRSSLGQVMHVVGARQGMHVVGAREFMDVVGAREVKP